MAELVRPSAEALDAALASPQRVNVLFFWGPNCPNCELFKARLPTLMEQLGDAPVSVLMVDAYAHPELATRFGVFGIPAFFLFRDGKKLGRMSQFNGDRYWLDVVREAVAAIDSTSTATS